MEEIGYNILDFIVFYDNNNSHILYIKFIILLIIVHTSYKHSAYNDIPLPWNNSR